jgi:hypothetical protein
VLLFFSCKKNNKISDSEELSQLANDYRNKWEEYKKNNPKEPFPFLVKPWIPGLAYDDSDKLPTPPPIPDIVYTLPYYYDGYWSMRHGEYYRLDDRNKYEKKIFFLKIYKGISGLYERLKCKLKTK